MIITEGRESRAHLLNAHCRDTRGIPATQGPAGADPGREKGQGEYRTLRNPRDMLHFVCSTEYFPFTLTLSLSSLRERESRFRIGNRCLADGCWANSGTGMIERRWTIHPLPWGAPGERAGVRGTECSLSHGPISNECRITVDPRNKKMTDGRGQNG